MKMKRIQRILSAVLCFLLIISCVSINAHVDTEAIKWDFLNEIFNWVEGKELLYEGGFTDIKPNDPNAGMVAALMRKGILDQTFADENGKLNLGDYLTTEELITLIVKTLIAKKNELAVGCDLNFKDKNEIDPKYLTYIEVAAANGIIENDEAFAPKHIVEKYTMYQWIDVMKESYMRLPVVKGSGIRRIQFPVIENSGVERPDYIDERYQLVFSDDFNGDSLDTTKWGYNYSWGHSHNHAAWCVPENVIVKDGILTLKGENKQHPDAQGKQGTFNNKKYDIVYTSGAVNTHHKYNFDYGYFEARMKMPKGKGMWPAWWMLKDGWPPEIDMLEVLCSKPNELHVNFHYGPAWNEHYSHEQVLNLGYSTSDDFHTYGFEWTPDYMRYYVDGVQVGHDFTNKSAIKEATGMYMILNLAIDGWDGKPDSSTQWPAEFCIDYVRAWQLNE